MTNLSNVSVEQLKRAVAVREQIEELQRELASILGEQYVGEAVSTNGRGGRRKMSPAARAKIAAAQRARWAKQKKGQTGQTGAAPAKGRRKMSPAARAKIAAAARVRWAKAKAANRNSLAAA